MRLSVCVDPGRPWDEVVALARRVDGAGGFGLYVCDHFMPHRTDGRPADGPMLEGWTTLAALAGVTRQVRLGTLVLGAAYRHPAVVANMAATLSQASGGRFVLGLGAGWQPNEHAAYGIPLPPVRERLDRFAEACAVVRALLDERRTDFDGRYYSLHDAPSCLPADVAAPPLLVGGGGERRTMRIAARYAQEWHSWATPDEFRRKCAVLDRHCAELSRDPAGLRRITGDALPDSWDTAEVHALLAAYRAAGADEFVVRDSATTPVAAAADAWSRLSSEVAPGLR